MGTSIQQIHPTIWPVERVVSAARTRAELTLAPERQPATFLRSFSSSPRWAEGGESLRGAAVLRACEECWLPSRLQES